MHEFHCREKNISRDSRQGRSPSPEYNSTSRSKLYLLKSSSKTLRNAKKRQPFC